MTKLLVYFKGYIKESIFGPLFKLLEATLELFVPLIIAAIIDIGIKNGDRSYIIRMCLVLVGLGIVGFGFSITAQYYAAKATVGFIKKLRQRLFSHIQSFSFSELDTIGTSTLLTRMTSDMNQLQTGVNLSLRLLLRSPFVVFGAMVMAFSIEFKIALIFTAAIPVLSIVVFGIMIWCISLYKKVQERLDKVLGYTRETLTGVRVIRAFSKEENEINNFEGLNEELTKMQKHVGRISSLMNPITYVIINLAIIALIYTGAIRVGTGIITQGAVVALYNYMAQILVELIKLANLIINITKSIACGNRIQAVLELNTNYEQTNKVTEKIKSNAIVEFKNVTLRYKNAGEYSLSDISFRVKRGETIGIIGGTGSGKSSFVNMIPRFYDATSGEVLVDGVNVKDYAVEQLRNKIAVVPQKAVLFKGTVRENIRWGKKDSSDEEIYEALTISQAKELVEAKGGLDFEIEPGGRNLSGGQKQRLTIARALIKKPEILILDDSSSALDYATDAALRNSIREMQHTPTVFVVSQRTSSIQYADKIIVLEDGIIVGMGKHEELMQSCQIYHEIYDSQFKKERA